MNRLASRSQVERAVEAAQNVCACSLSVRSPRSSRMKSLIARPSRRNSVGGDGEFRLRVGVAPCLRMRRPHWPVPARTVDLVTTTVNRPIAAATSAAAAGCS